MRERIRDSISPKGWGLPAILDGDSALMRELGLPEPEVRERAFRNTYEWMRGQFDEEKGAFHGFYAAPTRWYADPQTVNLIAPFQLLAAFDRYGDEELLDRARRSADWLEGHLVETHPMSLVVGGVLDNIKVTQLWTKYTGDYLALNLGLFDRLDREEYLQRAIRSGKFLLQAQNHDFATKYDHWHEKWIQPGWQSFGRVIVAMIRLHEFARDYHWLEWARRWGDYALTLQADNGCFYLINQDYYSSDIAADEMRSLVRLHQETGDERYLQAALRFADWHLANQRANGAWPLSEDHWGVTITEYFGPGDMPNIAIALLLLHRVAGKVEYLVSAVKALRYSFRHQQLPGRPDQPFADDPATHWGFWSWDPPHDYTMSADQSTHHVRGYWFFLDYFLSLPLETQEEVVRLTNRSGSQSDQAPALPLLS